MDILKGIRVWKTPDSHSAIINFSGNQMERILTTEKEKEWKITRQPDFTVDKISQFALKLILHSLQIGRYVNRIRVANGRQEIDWYTRAIEEDHNEKREIQHE